MYMTWPAPDVDLNAGPVVMLPCPFCGGPSCISVHDRDTGSAIAQPDLWPEDDLWAEAAVWCHSCGAQGQKIEACLERAEDYLRLELMAIRSWNERGNKNADSYETPLCTHPRPENWEELVSDGYKAMVARSKKTTAG